MEDMFTFTCFPKKYEIWKIKWWFCNDCKSRPPSTSSEIGRHLNTVSVQKYNRTRLNLDACVLSIKW